MSNMRGPLAMAVPPGASRVRNGLSTLFGALVILLNIGCEANLPNDRGDGPGHRTQQLGLRPDQELALGKQAYQQVLQESRGHILPADDPQVIRVRNIAKRIVL